MPTRLRRRVALAVVAAALLLLLSAFALVKQQRGPWFEYQTGPLSSAAFHALASHDGWRARVFEGKDTELRGLERRSETPGAPLVIFFPGNSATSLEDGRKFLTRLRGAHDWEVAVFAYRGFSGNAGDPNPEQLVADGLRVFEDLTRAASQRERPVHLVGYSLGASVAAVVAARLPAGRLRSLSLIASSPELVMRRGRFSAAQHYDLPQPPQSISCPILVLHGARDETLPLEGGRVVAERLGARFETLAQLGHHDIVEDDRALGSIRAFIVQHLR